MARQARGKSMDPAKVQVFHTVQRCVRRAFLCGEDAVSDKRKGSGAKNEIDTVKTESKSLEYRGVDEGDIYKEGGERGHTNQGNPWTKFSNPVVTGTLK